MYGFILEKLLPIYDSKYCSLLSTTSFHFSGDCRIPSQGNDGSFEAIHESMESTAGMVSPSISTFQLRSIPIPCDGFARFQQFIIHRAAPPNAEHNLRTMNIRSSR